MLLESNDEASKVMIKTADFFRPYASDFNHRRLIVLQGASHRISVICATNIAMIKDFSLSPLRLSSNMFSVPLRQSER